MTNKLRSLLALLLCAALLGSLILPASAATPILSGASTGATLVAGEAGELPFTLTYNASYLPGYLGGLLQNPFFSGNVGIVSGIVATLDTIGSAPLVLQGTSELRFGQLMRGASTGGAFTVFVPEDTRPTTFSVRVNVSYSFYPFIVDSENPAGGSLSTTPESHSLSVDIPVSISNPEYEAKTGKDIFEVTRRDIPEEATAGQSFHVGITVKNKLSYRLDDVTVRLVAPAGCYFDDDTSVKTMSIAANRTNYASFALKVSPDAVSGSHQVTATVSYTNPAGVEVSQDYFMMLGIKAAPTPIPADLQITAFTLPAELAAGERFSATVTVKNASADRTAENVSLSIAQENGLQTLSATKQILPTLAPGESTTLTVEYMAPATMPSTYCTFTAAYSYATAGMSGTETRTQDSGSFLRARAKPSLSITGLSIPADVDAGTDFTLAVTIKNNGGDAENLYFSIDPDAGFVYKSSTAKMIPALKAGASTTLSFKLCGGEGMTEGYKSIHLICSADGETLLDDYTGTNMHVPEKVEEPTNDVPVIIISSYEYGKEVFGGQTFTLSLTFRNTSKTTAARDLKITVSSAADDGVTAFTPANSSNTFFIEELAPTETVTQTIDLLVKGDLAPKSYGINVRFEYKNGAGTASDSANETLAIPVKQEVRFNIGEISSLTDISTMEEAYLTATFGNLGKSTIYNVIVKVTGEGFSCFSPEYYAGNIEAGKHLTYDFYLSPNGPGFAQGTLTYSYEDANGEKFTETQEFSFNINEANMDMGGMIGEPGFTEPIIDPETGYMFDEMTGQWIDPMTGEVVEDPTAGGDSLLGLPMMVWYIGGGALALIVLIVIIVCVKRAKKRKQEAEDADL